MGWLSITWPWLVYLIVGTWIFATVFCKPQPGDVADLPDTYFKDKYKELGPWTWKEIYTGIVLAITMIFWILAPTIGLDATVVAFGGCLLLCVGGLLNGKDFQNKVFWGLIMFIAVMFTIPGYLTTLGWAEVIKNVLGPVVAPLVRNVWIFVPAVMILNVLLRFIVASQMACLAIFLAIFTPLMQAEGIALIVMIWPLYMIGNYWLMPHQNPLIMACAGAYGSEYVTQETFCKTSWVYLAITFIGMMLTIPVFKMLGLC